MAVLGSLLLLILAATLSVAGTSFDRSVPESSSYLFF
jgi:hypothetical protein